MTQVQYIKQSRLALLDSLPKQSVCAELGVFRGDFSAEILSRCDPKQLYLVDLYEGIMRSGDRNGEDIHAINMSEEMLRVRERFPDSRVEMVKSCSWAWLEILTPGFLDWNYIDTDHSYETTRRELEASLSAVRPGGLICGHDYASDFPGVMRAVDELVLKKQWRMEIWDADRLPSYKIYVNSIPASV